MVRKPTIRSYKTKYIALVQTCIENGREQKSQNLETTRLRGRPRNRWQDEVRKDGRPVGGIGWREREYNREEQKKLPRTTRNHRILDMPMSE